MKELSIEEKFPELAKSEDEKIRKVLIGWVNIEPPSFLSSGFSKEQILAWLEKQGEKRAIWHNEDEEPQRGSLILLIMQSGNPIVAKIIEPNHTFNHGERWAYIDDLLEKQGEQNLVKHFCDCVHVGCHVNDCKRWCHSYQKEISYTDCNSNCNRYSKPVSSAFNIGETITDGISAFKIADIKDNYYIANDGERVEMYMAHRYYTIIQNLEVQKPTEDLNL